MARTTLIAPVPGLTNLIRCLYKFIANHPLIINPIIKHPSTGDLVGIDRYRLYDGIELRSGLSCSVFAYAGAQGKIPSPSSSNVSAMFEPWELGPDGHDHAIFHLVIKFSFNDVVIGNISEDKNLIQVPAWSQFGVGQRLLTSNTKKSVTLEINPGIEIVQDYLQLTKYILDDSIHAGNFPIQGVKSFEMLSQNVKSTEWEQEETIYFQEGVALTRFEAYISRGWRDNLDPLYLSRTNINPTIN